MKRFFIGKKSQMTGKKIPKISKRRFMAETSCISSLV